MASNDITVEAAPALSTCIATKNLLTKLDLAENELKDDGAIQIGKALQEGHEQLTEVDLTPNSIRRAAAQFSAQVMVLKPGFKLQNIDGNFILEDGIDEVKSIFEKSLEMPTSLDENDLEGRDEDEECEESEGEGEANEGELESKSKNLEVGEE